MRELRAQGHSIRQIEAELQGQLNLFRVETPRIARLLTPFEEALLLHEQGDAAAAEHYLEAIKEGDNVAEAYCNLGIINLERGQIPNALDNFTLSLKNDPRHVEAHYNLANLYYDAGDLQLAKLHYEAAAQIEPGFSLVYFNLSLVYHKLGDLNAASATLEKYLQLEPEDEDLEVLNQLLKAMKSGRLRRLIHIKSVNLWLIVGGGQEGCPPGYVLDRKKGERSDFRRYSEENANRARFQIVL